MPKKKEEWWVMHCSQCKKVVEDTQPCCHRYLCDSCHMKVCHLAPMQATINNLRWLACNLHIALNQSLAGETIPPERLENLNENVSVHLGPNYESVKQK